MPAAPGLGIPWLLMIVSDPEPATREYPAMGGSGPWPVEHLSQPIFTAVETGIPACSLFDAFNERDRLGHTH